MMKKVISATEFMQQNVACERSVLVPFADDILLLKDNGYTDKQVLLFLEMNGVKVAQSALNQFIKKKRQQSRVSSSLKSANAVEAAPPQSQVASIEKSPCKVPTEQANSTSADKPKFKKGIKKFDWKNATTDGLI